MLAISSITPRIFQLTGEVSVRRMVMLSFSWKQILSIAELPSSTNSVFSPLAFHTSPFCVFLLNSWATHYYLLTNPACLKFYLSYGSVESHIAPSCLSNFLRKLSHGYIAGLRWSKDHESLEHSWNHTRVSIVEGFAQSMLLPTV